QRGRRSRLAIVGAHVCSLFGLRIHETLNCKIQIKINHSCQSLSGNLVAEISIAEKLNDYAGPPAASPNAAKESLMRLKSIHEFSDFLSKPVILNGMSNGMPPSCVWILSGEDGAFWRPPRVANATDMVAF